MLGAQLHDKKSISCFSISSAPTHNRDRSNTIVFEVYVAYADNSDQFILIPPTKADNSDLNKPIHTLPELKDWMLSALAECIGGPQQRVSFLTLQEQYPLVYEFISANFELDPVLLNGAQFCHLLLDQPSSDTRPHASSSSNLGPLTIMIRNPFVDPFAPESVITLVQL